MHALPATVTKRQRLDECTSGGAGTMSAAKAAKPVEDVAGETDFNSLTQWLMTNTKDKEVCTRECIRDARTDA